MMQSLPPRHRRRRKAPESPAEEKALDVAFSGSSRLSSRKASRALLLELPPEPDAAPDVDMNAGAPLSEERRQFEYLDTWRGKFG